MALVRQINFNLGTPYEKFGAVPTITGSTFSMKERGWALETGLNKYIQYNSQLLPNDAFSIVVWGKINTSIAPTYSLPLIANVSTFTATSCGILFSRGFLGINKISIVLNTSSCYVMWNSLPLTTWACYIFTITGNTSADLNNAKLYVNSVLQTREEISSANTPIARSNFTYLGGSNSGSNSKTYLSKIKIYNHVLTSRQILQEQIEFENAKPILSPKRYFQVNKPLDLSYQKSNGLLAAYNMQSKGTILPDISGNNNTGTCSNVINTKEGLLFNGTNSVVSLTGSSGLTGNITICCRVFAKTAGNLNRGVIFNSEKLTLYSEYETLSAFGFSRNSSTTVYRFSNTFILRKWLNLVITSTSTGSSSLYINGVLIEANVAAGTPGSSTVWKIGNHYSLTNRCWDGTIQDLRIYNRILGAQEIEQYHNSFAEVPYINETFSSEPADGSNIVPKEWVKGTGSYKCSEYVIQKGIINTGWNLTTWSTIRTGLPLTSKSFSTSTTGGVYDGIYKTNQVVIGKRYLCRLKGQSTNNFKLADTTTGISYHSQTLIGSFDVSFAFTPTLDTTLYLAHQNTGTVVLDIFDLQEIYPLPTFKQGTKYLQCVTSGTIAIPSNMAYGVWNAAVYKGADANVSDLLVIASTRDTATTSGQNGYVVRFGNDEKFYLYKITNGVLSSALITSASTYANSTWYSVKLTRTYTGLFTLYINNTSIGTATDTTFSVSNYLTMDYDSSDRIANILLKKEIEV